MSMSIHVHGVRNLDGKFAKLMAVKLACDEAETDYPLSIVAYFGDYAEESEESIREQMEEIDIDDATEKPDLEGRDVYEVDLSKLGPEVTKIRFTVNY